MKTRSTSLIQRRRSNTELTELTELTDNVCRYHVCLIYMVNVQINYLLVNDSQPATCIYNTRLSSASACKSSHNCQGVDYSSCHL